MGDGGVEGVLLLGAGGAFSERLVGDGWVGMVTLLGVDCHVVGLLAMTVSRRTRSTLRRECMGFRSEGAGPPIRWLRALSLTCRPLAALRGLTS